MAGVTDVVVVGGGVIGCSIAYELAKRGLDCTLLEKSAFGAGASGATAGVVSPLRHVDPGVRPMWQLGMRSLELFPVVAAELARAGIDPEFRQTGVLKLAFSEEQAEELHEEAEWQQAARLGVEWLDADDVLRREPDVNHDVLGGVNAPLAGYVRGQRLVDSLVHAATRLGARCHQSVEVTGLVLEGDRVTGVETSTGVVYAGHVVLAAGPWTGIKGRWLTWEDGWDVPVRPVKGERVLLRKAGLLPRSTVHNFRGYVVPWADGNVLVASTRIEGRFDERVTAKGIAELIASATLSYPGLADAEFVGARAGVRPATPDGMPVLGPAPGVEGLSIAAGHDAVGVMLSPATAELMCQYIVDGNAEPLEPFSLERFRQC
jgi:glycine oxidase